MLKREIVRRYKDDLSPYIYKKKQLLTFLDSISSKITEVESQYGEVDDIVFDLSYNRTYYDDIDVSLNFELYTKETDEEYAERLAKAKVKAEKDKLTKKLQKEREAEIEIELYKKLKEKYEGK